MEVRTVAALVDILKSGNASGSRGRATMEAARALLITSDGQTKSDSVYGNEFDIKTAWIRKGSVAHLCAAFVVLLNESGDQNLTSHNYTAWAERMQSFLTSAFDAQKFLANSTNFAPQSSISISLQLLPNELDLRAGADLEGSARE